jgi:outer membrane biosynthesis protein TonB
LKSPVILRVYKNGQLVVVKQFEQNQIVIGQDGDVQMKLDGDGVSAIHCMIELRDSGYYVCDLGSFTGTFKNGQAVLDSAISSGDKIGVGPYEINFFVGVPKPVSAPGATQTAPSASPVVEGKVEPTPPTPTPTPVPPPPPTPKIPETKPAPPPEPTPVPQAKKAVEAQPKPVVAKPELKSGSSKHISKQKTSATFAPGNLVGELSDYLKPTKGTIVEVIVAWQNRILQTYHFKEKGIVRIGSGEGFVELPEQAAPKGWPLLEISGGVRVAVNHDMGFALVQSNGRKDMDEMVKAGKATKNGSGALVRLDQNEMICLTLMSGTMQVFVRYVPATGAVPLVSTLLLSGPEMTAVVMSLVLVGLLAFYISATAPLKGDDEKQEDITRTAQIIFTPPKHEVKPPPPPENPPPPKQVEPPPPEKAKVADKKQETHKKGEENKTQSSKAATAGRAAEVAPIPNSENRPKKFTSTHQGGAIKLGEKAGANAKTKDLNNAGLFSAFGSGGSRKKLDPNYSGAGGILGQADKATGTSGMDSNRAGDDLGSKFKDTGAGGKGTATEGISGIGTKGRSSGQGLYGSADGFGDKSSVAVDAGDSEADFAGTIDKEAVRRVIRHYLYEIRGCYTKELNKLERGQRLEGKVAVTWDIVAKGAAKNVRISSTSLHNKNIEECIRARLSSWEFPSPPVGMTAEVTYPFVFRPEK